MSMKWVRDYYGVPAKRGGRVEYTGSSKSEMGTIASASNGRLNIRLDGIKHTMPVHPTWKLRYLDAGTLEAVGSSCLTRQAPQQVSRTGAQTASAGTSDFDWIENPQVGR